MRYGLEADQSDRFCNTRLENTFLKDEIVTETIVVNVRGNADEHGQTFIFSGFGVIGIQHAIVSEAIGGKRPTVKILRQTGCQQAINLALSRLFQYCFKALDYCANLTRYMR